MSCSLDIFFVEAILNGLLLAGLLALLSLGLNLIFGVVDVVWICYAELVMAGMYGVYWAFTVLGLPLPFAILVGVGLTAGIGALLHMLVINPLLDAPPINQLLATGGVIFVLQALATMAFGVEFRSLGVQLGSFSTGDMFFSWSRVITLAVAVVAIVLLRFFLRRSWLGLAILALSQDRRVMPLMGVDAKRLYAITSAIGGGLAGLGGALMAMQFDTYPQIGLQFGPLIFMVCVLGGLGNILGGLVAASIIAQLITVGGSCFASEWGYAIAFLFFMVIMFIRPQGVMRVR